MEQEFVERGWQCPICGAVMSLRERVCVNCRGNKQAQIIGTTTPIGTDNPPQIYNITTSNNCSVKTGGMV